MGVVALFVWHFSISTVYTVRYDSVIVWGRSKGGVDSVSAAQREHQRGRLGTKEWRL